MKAARMNNGTKERFSLPVSLGFSPWLHAKAASASNFRMRSRLKPEVV